MALQDVPRGLDLPEGDGAAGQWIVAGFASRASIATTIRCISVAPSVSPRSNSSSGLDSRRVGEWRKVLTLLDETALFGPEVVKDVADKFGKKDDTPTDDTPDA